MKKIFLLLNIALCLNTFGQQYHWDFAMSTGICPLISRTYPYDLNLINDNVLEPIGLETDKQGNVYVLGCFRPSPGTWANEYQITPTQKINAVQGTYLNALYIYKLNVNGELLWANSISNIEQPMGDFDNKATFTVNPYSGKVYILSNALSHININQTYINTNVDNSVNFQKRMMICLNADGTYSNTVFSPAVMDKPVFSSANMGVIKRSKIAEFYPWDDSVSFFTFDAEKDSVLKYQFAGYETIIKYDEQKQVYLTQSLAEYNTNMVKVSNAKYNHNGISYYGGEVQYWKDKNGAHYFYYPNTNIPSNKQFIYFALKLDANYNKLWHVYPAPSFQVDSNGNPWITATDNRNIANNPSDFHLLQLNPTNGLATNTRIVPTNLIQQTNSAGLFKISANNDYWIAGHLYNEAEFGNYQLSMLCNGDYLPLQHYLARAKEGWQQDRKNLSIKNKSKNGLNIFPNPATNYIQIENKNNTPILAVEILNTLGVKQNIEINNNTINTENLASGIYTLKLILNNNTQTFKFIKQ